MNAGETAPRPAEVPKGTASIVVERVRTRWQDRVRRYRIVVDGATMAKLGPGERETLTVEPGRHRVHAAIDWCRSPFLDIELGPGETAQLEVSHNANPLTVLYYITFGSTRYLKLVRSTDGRMGPTSA